MRQHNHRRDGIIIVHGDVVVQEVLRLTFRSAQHNPSQSLTHQQAVGGVDGDAAGERVMDGERVQVGAALIHVAAHVEVDRVVVPLCLLSHVLQLHLRQVH